jgi:hypothetical protein
MSERLVDATGEVRRVLRDEPVPHYTIVVAYSDGDAVTAQHILSGDVLRRMTSILSQHDRARRMNADPDNDEVAPIPLWIAVTPDTEGWLPKEERQ